MEAAATVAVMEAVAVTEAAAVMEAEAAMAEVAEATAGLERQAPTVLRSP